MKQVYCFEDVRIVPQYSTIRSRADVDTSVSLLDETFKLPIISSNMDSVTGPTMSKTMLSLGAGSCLHRFCSIEENVKQFKDSCYENRKPWVSVGIGNNELERAEALVQSGAETLVLDVAHGASLPVVEQTLKLKQLFKNVNLVVGNFATKQTINDFNFHIGSYVDAYKVGIGSGAACITTKVTGCGIPLFSTVEDCVMSGFNIIADGGCKNSGDIAKVFALGAKGVFLGRMLAGCEESNAEKVFSNEVKYAIYRGSASAPSYVVQGKVAKHRTPEGEYFKIPVTGSVKDVLQNIEAGLRSSMSYVGAINMQEFKERADFVVNTSQGYVEGLAHGKNHNE